MKTQRRKWKGHGDSWRHTYRGGNAPPDVPRTNPYYRDGYWYWFDETGSESKSFHSERAALTALLIYARYLEIGPTPSRWARFKYELRRFWRDTRGSSKGKGQASS